VWHGLALYETRATALTQSDAVAGEQSTVCTRRR
jgi:hypothetical protein